MNRRYRDFVGLGDAALGGTLADAARAALPEGVDSDSALRTLEYLRLSQNAAASSLTQRTPDGRFIHIEHEPLANGGFLHIVQELTGESVEAPGAREKRRLEADLGRALVERQFELYYQPIVAVEPFGIVGFEALLRWRHPVHGLLAPSRFVSLAEEIGLIGAIGEWVVEDACREAASWPHQSRVAVNVSPAQLKGKSFVDCIKRVLAATGLAPERLELELTENLQMEPSEEAFGALRVLRGLGVRIAVDDFGTGWSSLNYLRRFRFDKVKIDRVFVQGLDSSPDCLAILRAVTTLCRSLGIETTAEGVETLGQMTTAAAERCTQMQGFLFSQPKPSSDLPAMIAAGLPAGARLRRTRAAGKRPPKKRGRKSVSVGAAPAVSEPDERGV